MIPKNRLPTHPGEMLRHTLEAHGITQAALARHLGVPTQRINALIRGKRDMTPAMAWMLSGALGTTPEVWLYAQAIRDLAATRRRRQVRSIWNGR